MDLHSSDWDRAVIPPSVTLNPSILTTVAFEIKTLASPGKVTITASIGNQKIARVLTIK